MSDYSFMQSGIGNGVVEPEPKFSETDILSLISVFVENAMKTAAKHVRICRRNGVTCEDITYGLIYEVFNWLKRETLLEDFKEAKKEIEQMEEDGDGDSDYEEINDIIVPDDQIEKFTRCSQIEGENEEFLKEFYEYYDNWDKWEPSNSIENALKNAVDKILIKF